MSCPYANLLGIPGQGIHAARVFGLARNDILGTIFIASISSYLFNISFLYSILFWFILGEVLHYAFGTQTAFLTAIGLAPQCSNNFL